MSRDTRERYGTVSRFFHWTVALLVIWQALKLFDRIDDGEHWVGQTLVPWHISIGVLVLLLVVPRIVWALRNQGNRPPAPPPRALGLLAKAGHVALYVALLLMPLTGLAIMLGNGYGLTVFGMELVAKGAEIPWLANVGGALHSPLAWLLVAMVLGHAGMALVHHFIRKDGVLRRML
ncbi:MULTISPECIES: cytochrome b [unclassified Luteimonas]|uniref:cytochrome b n=1 Tax=unclassified Luteimonas TaxID=2629088 RepID=UPI0018F0C0CA|nr:MULTISPECIES: cytochrome b [unclassified Luteimonas]MBJ6979354.1 cytochrome b [Luteimonas sp. MC1895]MBJ6984431.1 cytochrome b [Luteimonas sp. MC1750]QQO04953.1 cytochrome b [Luteimonas sp. MC1750]